MVPSCEGVEIIDGKRVGVSSIIDFDSLHPEYRSNSCLLFKDSVVFSVHAS